MEKEVYLNVRQSRGERVLAACDKEILGKKFSEGEVKLEVKEDFYKGSLDTLENLKKEIQKASIVNLAGNKVVDFALHNEFLDEESILKISGIKHAQIISV